MYMKKIWKMFSKDNNQPPSGDCLRDSVSTPNTKGLHGTYEHQLAQMQEYQQQKRSILNGTKNTRSGLKVQGWTQMLNSTRQSSKESFNNNNNNNNNL